MVTSFENFFGGGSEDKISMWRSGKKEVPNSRFEARRREPECSTPKVKKKMEEVDVDDVG